MASLKSLNKLPNTRVFIAAEKWMVKPHANRRNIVGQQLPTLLDVACCVRLHTLLHVVGCCCAKFETSQTFQPTTPNISFVPWSPKHSATICTALPTLLGVVASVCAPLPTRTQQLPTSLRQQCWELLRPFARSLRGTGAGGLISLQNGNLRR